jgi:hypothetical protein
MELLKRKILLEDYTDRNYNSPTYGAVTATSFYVNVVLQQDIDDMGLFTDITYLPNFAGTFTPADYTALIIKLAASGLTFPFMSGAAVTNLAGPNDIDVRLTGKTEAYYYNFGNQVITGTTDSKKEDVKTYSAAAPFQLGFDVNTESYTNYQGQSILGVDRITYLGTASTYTFGTDKNDPNIGTPAQTSGILFVDLSGNAKTTNFSYSGEGWNQTNVSLSAITKEEYLFGVISRPEIQSDVFIDRGITTIYEKHLKLSEITNLDELSRYGKGFYGLIKQ